MIGLSTHPASTSGIGRIRSAAILPVPSRLLQLGEPRALARGDGSTQVATMSVAGRVNCIRSGLGLALP
jgi:hypothetical protein